MTDADNMVDIAQSELEKLVGEYAARICEAKETMVGEDCPQAHSPSMQNGFVA